MKNRFRLCLAFILLTGITSPAFAYLDPATGSMIIQGLIAGIVFLMATARSWWKKAKSFITNTPITDDDTEDNNEQNNTNDASSLYIY